MRQNRVFSNVKWVVLCKVAQSVLQLLIGMLTARYLGPADYGLINYAKSIVAFAIPFMQLGLEATLVKELVDRPDMEGKIMGTSLGMGMISSFLCFCAIGGMVSVVNYGEPQTILVCVLYSVTLFFQAIELIQHWFHSKLKSKYPSIMVLVAYVVVSVFKIYLLVSKKSVAWFAISFSIEYGLNGLALLAVYHIQKNPKFSFSVSLAKDMLSRSHHYIWAALMVTVFQNTDHIMLTTMMGNAENGYYSAAITSAGVCQFVYCAIIDTMRPVIIESKKINHVEYQKNMKRLYGVVLYLTLAQAILFTVFADLIIYILYGVDFVPAVSVLRILVWYLMFSFMGAIRNVWILAEGKQKYLWRINLFGVFCNVILNSVFIRLWGAEGAALASLLTQCLMNFVLGFFVPMLRENNCLILESLNPRVLKEMLVKR